MREDFVCTHDIRVRWGELDSQGIVFNPNYFAYFDIGVTEYMRAIGFPYPEGLSEPGTDFFAVNANANFRASAEFDDIVTICTRVARIGRSSMRFEFGLFRGELLLVDGSLVYVTATTDEPRKSVPLPEAFVERIADYERVAPER